MSIRPHNMMFLGGIALWFLSPIWFLTVAGQILVIVAMVWTVSLFLKGGSV